MKRAENAVCPFCGQAVMAASGAYDARQLCGCYYANRYRRTVDALDRVSTDAEPMKEIDMEVLDMLRDCAYLIGALKLAKVDAYLSDGSKVQIAAKVSRTTRIKHEEKVDE